MFPVLFEVGPFTVYMYGLMIAIGFLLVVFLLQREARQHGLDPKIISEMAFWTLFFGVVGSRIAHIVMYPEGYALSDPLGWINVSRGGLVFQGALAAAFLYCILAVRRRKLNFWSMADMVLPYVPLGQAFGRVGCFFFGCCYGVRADDLPWAMQFPAGSPAHQDHMHHFPDFQPGALWSFPVHPTQLYSVVLLLLMFAVLLTLQKKKLLFTGFALPLYLVLYGLKRFLVEMFRGDGNPTNLGFGIITNQQVFSLLMVVVGIALLLYLRGRKLPTSLTA